MRITACKNLMKNSEKHISQSLYKNPLHSSSTQNHFISKNNLKNCSFHSQNDARKKNLIVPQSIIQMNNSHNTKLKQNWNDYRISRGFNIQIDCFLAVVFSYIKSFSTINPNEDIYPVFETKIPISFALYLKFNCIRQKNAMGG